MEIGINRDKPIHGKIRSIIYSSDNYHILEVISGNDKIIVKGNFSVPNIGMRITIHPGKHSGNSIIAKHIGISIPKNTMDEEELLSSLPNTGPLIAIRILSKVGRRCISRISSDKSLLNNIRGVSKNRAKLIFKDIKEINDIMLLDFFFDSHNIDKSIISSLPKNISFNKIKSNPYLLLSKTNKISFSDCDTIASKIGFSRDSYNRILYYSRDIINKEAVRFGSTAFIYADLLSKVSTDLNLDTDTVGRTMSKIITQNDLSSEEIVGVKYLQLPEVSRDEDIIVMGIKHLINTGKHISKRKFESLIKKASSNIGKTLYKKQMQAVEMACFNTVSIITGGPGTGKTTILEFLVDVLKNNGETINLTSFTGRAAKKMEAVAKISADTIHSLLKSNPTGVFNHNKMNKLSSTTVIIDESSMVELSLAASLIDAMNKGCRIIFVGDANQIPSIGPGRVLMDLIESKSIPTTHLEGSRRQKEGSLIIKNSNSILNDQDLELETNISNESDFYLIEANTQLKISSEIENLFINSMEYFGVSASDIQILSSLKRGPAGTENLNNVVRPIVNPEHSKDKSNHKLSVGDKVIQNEPNKDLGLSNGSIGVVTESNPSSIDVFIEGRTVTYSMKDIFGLSLSSAITIHKSQGGEYPVVIIPVTESHLCMLDKTLLFTGVTRGKQKVVLVGSKKALDKSMKNDLSSLRASILHHKLSKAL